MKHEPVIMYSREWLEHERRKAWQEGYAAGWKDQECVLDANCWKYVGGYEE